MLRKRLMTAKAGAAGTGFRWRGHEVSRLEGLSDAVFGFAITLLVVSLEVPRTFTELMETMHGFGAFAVSFALLFSIWHQQYTFFRRYGLQDGATVVLNAVLLFTVLFFVYPLKFVFTLLIGQFTGRPLPPVRLDDGTLQPVVTGPQAGTMMLVYGAGYVAIFAAFALLYLHAYRHRDVLALTPLERHDTWERVTANVLNAGIGVLSLSVVLLGGGRYALIAGLTYVLVGPVMGVHGTVMGSRRRRLMREHVAASSNALLAAALAAAVALAPGTLAAQGPPGSRGTAIPAGAACPPGTTEVRPRSCQAPELPAPSIVDYRPRSTLVTPAHLVPRAKYPAIDFHGHPQGLVGSAEGLDRLGASLDSLNVRLMVVANNTSGEALRRMVATVRASPRMRDRVRVLAGIDFRDVGPGWAERAVAQLEADVAAGAVGVGEISKSFGLTITKRDGTRLRLDDPALDPVWAACARLRIPVFIHTADPQEFWQPIDFANERWLELALFPGRRYPAGQFPPFEELVTERDNMLRRNPRTTFVIAHMGWHANDLARLGRLLAELPNVHTEVGAVLYDIGRQPRAARDFFVRFQDRILFGKDSFQPEEYPYYWRVFETSDDYFDYYRGYHAFWKLYGIALPDSVLKKVYYGNALRITAGLPQAGWPR